LVLKKKMNKSIFLAAPISGFKNETIYLKFREFIIELISSLRHEGFDVFSELEQILSVEDYDSPAESIEDDFTKIKSSDIFLMIHPFRLQTSSLIELGFAYACERKILIVGNRKDLPYLAIGLEESKVVTRIIDVKKINKSVIPKIIQYLQGYK